ncbi:membrane protein insertion efficiency factor YidD [Klebsiella pneumoniae]
MRRFDAIKGSWLAFKRLLRCLPKQIFGFDPVPESILRK